METCGKFGNSIGGSFLLPRDVDRCSISTRRRRIYVGGGGGGFADNGHLRHYVSQVRFGGNTVEECKRKKTAKKISKDVLDLMCMEEKERTEGVVHEIGNKGMTDGGLLAQFEDLRIEVMMMRKKRKKALKKMMKMEKDTSSSSSSSSESSDSDCEDGVQQRSNDKTMKKMKKEEEKVMKKIMKKKKKKEEMAMLNMMMIKDSSDSCDQVVSTIITPANPTTTTTTTTKDADAKVPLPKIEVCMGGQCKKSGARQLKEEFEKNLGSESVVDGCKCMGKCKEGPNVRILNHRNKEEGRNPLCIGVCLEDVKTIAATYFGKKKNDDNMYVPPLLT